jgi:isopentenyl diphosphate isomerase/L-lactate dehydrogenase-like FMN-dependent dehydrogenase
MPLHAGNILQSKAENKSSRSVNMSSHNTVHRPNMAKHSDPDLDPDPIAYETEVYQRGLHYEKPPFTFQPLKWEEMAMARMSAESAGYVVGSAGIGETAKKNRRAFEKWSIVPRRLVGTEGFPDLSVKVLGGQRVPFPIAAAPVGVMRIFNPEGEVAVARACEKCRIPYIMSTASSTSIEEAAKANGDGIRWFQLYWPSRESDSTTISMLRRAKAAGFTALFVTLDTYVLGWRPSDMDNG